MEYTKNLDRRIRVILQTFARELFEIDKRPDQPEFNKALDRTCAYNEAVGKIKRLASVQKRIHAGICPCCNRHFANIERHMATKHPKQEAAGK